MHRYELHAGDTIHIGGIPAALMADVAVESSTEIQLAFFSQSVPSLDKPPSRPCGIIPGMDEKRKRMFWWGTFILIVIYTAYDALTTIHNHWEKERGRSQYFNESARTVIPE